ncbi:hypothetical protein [Aeromicrobium stalagmiti]|uniref:hypothetical protein n=1 Tax=Aeromicrobium stalagmiti TaxID=2738988 RepID=UPI0015684FFD|nr:hypothetical protein [Aeromicrobium stalagmiti]NRQ48882.1 hypothetical protein [Aeromicrobium stalagmiti]
MRKALIALAGATVLLGLFSPAEAATRTYSIVLNPAPAGKTDPAKSYNDTALDVSEDTDDGRQKTRIKGYVKRGKVASTGTVKIYATNTSTNAKTRKLLGSVTLSKSGYFTRTFDPGHDNAGIYKIEIVKGGGSGYATTTKTFHIRVFQFVEAMNEYVPGQPGVTYVQDAIPAYGTKYDQSYLVDGGSTVEFDFTGYTCLQFNFKMTRASNATTDGEFAVSLGSTFFVPQWQPLYGEQYTAPSSVQKLMTSGGKLRFAVKAHDDMDGQTVDDNQQVTMILGRPMVSCTYPVINP